MVNRGLNRGVNIHEQGVEGGQVSTCIYNKTGESTTSEVYPIVVPLHLLKAHVSKARPNFTKHTKNGTLLANVLSSCPEQIDFDFEVSVLLGVSFSLVYPHTLCRFMEEPATIPMLVNPFCFVARLETKKLWMWLAKCGRLGRAHRNWENNRLTLQKLPGRGPFFSEFCLSL